MITRTIFCSCYQQFVLRTRGEGHDRDGGRCRGWLRRGCGGPGARRRGGCRPGGDAVADVVLVEPRDAFVHNVAALRALVDPGWVDRIFLPYDRLLARGRVVRDRAVRVDAGSVTLGSGQTIDADYIVLATGSAYPFPAKTEDDDSAGARARIRRAPDEPARGGRGALLGAGPVGLELAGEITAAWPGKSVTIIDPLSDILSGGYAPAGYDSGFRAELRRQLRQHGVSLLLETSLPSLPPTAPGLAEPFTVTTRDGRQLEADIWFRCFGVTPALAT